MNYGQLQTEILDIAKLTSSDTVGARVTKFIRRAEGMIAEFVRALEMVTYGTIVEGSRVTGGVYSLPADYLKRISIFGSYGGAQYQVAPAALAELRSYSSSAPPFWHAIYGRRVEFRGSPPNGSSFDLVYFARPATMSSASDEPALLTAHESLYLHGALHWLYFDAHDSNLAAAHKQGFLEDAERVNATAREAMKAGVVAMEYNYAAGSAM